MSLIQSLIEQGEGIGLDRIVITVQPRGDGAANAIVHFAVDQQSSYKLDAKTTALRSALSQPIVSEGNGSQIELAIAEALHRMNAVAKLAVDQYREKTNADDVISALVASINQASDNQSEVEAGGETDSTPASELANLPADNDTSAPDAAPVPLTTEDDDSVLENASLF
ncbi:hypothetical protein [Reinekea sp. G2M2-21]|uniref:hypothetical protein n=1 Tax=Reinekea sp. G2M2-21 TaxID=2788942 RepID=UPI0018A8B2B0|nr:hypothetical protein [Reinekea sp. G2M2-21]